jgi:hypothetical protein
VEKVRQFVFKQCTLVSVIGQGGRGATVCFLTVQFVFNSVHLYLFLGQGGGGATICF